MTLVITHLSSSSSSPSLAPAHTPRSPSYHILAFISWLLHLALSLPAGSALPSAFPPLAEGLTLPQPSPGPGSLLLEGCSGGCPQWRGGEPPSLASLLVPVFSGINLGGVGSSGAWLDAQRDTLTHNLTLMAAPPWWMDPGVPWIGGSLDEWGSQQCGTPPFWSVRGDLGMEQSPCCSLWWLWMCFLASLPYGQQGRGWRSLGCAKLL